jgi:signal transduction histidine kinase
MAVDNVAVSSFDTYAQALREYFETRSELALYRASVLSQGFVESGLGPEDIVALHFEALDRTLATYSDRKQARVIADAGQFLLEVMIGYGVRYKDYLEYRTRESLHHAASEAAAARRRVMEADRATRDKDEILAVIAHELRTPITAAMSTLQLASHSLSRGQTESVPRHLSMIQQALERLSRLSADLVEASRGDMPRFQRAPVDVAEVLSRAYDWAAGVASGSGVELDIEWQGDGHAGSVLGNVDALLTIFGNLLSNAVRYTPAGGQVSVSHAIDTVGRAVRVDVHDTGIGMSADVRARIFEKFYRAPQAQMVEAHGLGLGLSLVLQLVDAHGGRVDVESEPGKGSTFRVVLPLID